ncbi:MAG TPA: hypothetical protein ENK33_11140 [Desulfobacterales bacterium]|nr:hypothetical protein [Desulfobacterales bacterium]
MKKGFILLAAAGLIIISGISYSNTGHGRASGNGRAEGTASQLSQTAAHKIISVKELAANPAAFSGNIILRGVVAGVNKSQKIFGIIDLSEFKSCGTLLCARYTLPVKYSGNPPEVKSIVKISGRLIKNHRGLIIEAGNIQVVK